MNSIYLQRTLLEQETIDLDNRVLTIEQEASKIIIESDYQYKMIMNTIGISESYRTVILEEGKIRAFFDKIIKWFKDLIQKIKNFFLKLFGKLKDQSKKIEEAVEEIKTKQDIKTNKALPDKIPPTIQVTGREIEASKFKTGSSIKLNTIFSVLFDGKYESATNILIQIKPDLNGIDADANNERIRDITEKIESESLEDRLSVFRGKIVSSHKYSVLKREDFREAIEKEVYMSEEKTIRYTIPEIEQMITEIGKLINTIANDINNIVSDTEKYIKKIETPQRELERAEKGGYGISGYTRLIGLVSNIVRSQLNIVIELFTIQTNILSKDQNKYISALQDTVRSSSHESGFLADVYFR